MYGNSGYAPEYEVVYGRKFIPMRLFAFAAGLKGSILTVGARCCETAASFDRGRCEWGVGCSCDIERVVVD